MDQFRISHWEQFVGQAEMKERLRIHITAARKQERPLDHVLLIGKTGFGKTALAHIIANSLHQPLTTAIMPLTETGLTRLAEDTQGVLFLDEIHAASTKIQEALQPLLEFGFVQNGRGIKRYSQDLTIVAATTEPEKLIKPLWDRFPIRPDFDEYSIEEMGQIVVSMAEKAGVKLDQATAEQLGRATDGTPRRAAQFVLAARDLILEMDRTPTGTEILGLCRVDGTGLTQSHQAYLSALDLAGGQAGLSTLRNLLRLSEGVVRELEPLLLRLKLIRFTPGGRELTRQGQLKLEGSNA